MAIHSFFSNYKLKTAVPFYSELTEQNYRGVVAQKYSAVLNPYDSKMIPFVCTVSVSFNNSNIAAYIIVVDDGLNEVRRIDITSTIEIIQVQDNVFGSENFKLLYYDNSEFGAIGSNLYYIELSDGVIFRYSEIIRCIDLESNYSATPLSTERSPLKTWLPFYDSVSQQNVSKVWDRKQFAAVFFPDNYIRMFAVNVPTTYTETTSFTIHYLGENMNVCNSFDLGAYIQYLEGYNNVVNYYSKETYRVVTNLPFFLEDGFSFEYFYFEISDGLTSRYSEVCRGIPQKTIIPRYLLLESDIGDETDFILLENNEEILLEN